MAAISVKIVSGSDPKDLERAIKEAISNYTISNYTATVKDIQYTHTMLPASHFTGTHTHWFTAYITFTY